MKFQRKKLSPHRRTSSVAICFLMALLGVFLLAMMPPVEETRASLLDLKPKSPPTLKYILFYNPFWEWPDYKFGFEQEPFAQCPVSTCFTTNNQSLLDSSMSKFDAVLFHGLDFHLDGHVRSAIAKWRQPHQHFIFFMLEPPTNYAFLSAGGYNDFFNLTMTYRRDSDIVRPYGRVVAKKERRSESSLRKWPVQYDETAARSIPSSLHHLAQRPNKVAWVVSNCHSSSKRELFVEELQKYIQVDVFGKCGTASCDFVGAQAGVGNCSSLGDNYKFYLSLENSFSRDYVTEKLFSRMEQNLLPIVLGQADYNQVVPPHSCIHALDYESPRALAEHLNHMTDSEYLSYFWWHEHYTVESDSRRMQQVAFCDLCAKLHQEHLQPSSSYQDFGTWWSEEAHVNLKLPTLLINMLNQTMPPSSSAATMTRGRPPRLRMNFAE